MSDRTAKPDSGSGPAQAMSFQVMSDLHLERIKYDFNVPKTAPNLILAGDIGRFCDREGYARFLATQCEQFERVFLVPGNHEFYGSSRSQGLESIDSIKSSNPPMEGKFVLLDRGRMDFADSDVTLLGCTLFTNIAPDYKRLTNDFERTKDWKIRDHNEYHERDLHFLKSHLEDLAGMPPRRVVIVTHFAPAFENTCHPAHEGSDLGQCFCSDTLRQVLTWPGHELITHWIFGHTHWNAEFKFGNITVMSNQLMGNEDQGLSETQRRDLFRPFDINATIEV